MTKIYLIRHAEAEGNLYRIAHGQYNSIITDRGYRQIAALRERFRDIPIDACYTSDLYRTCETASALFVPKKLPLQKRRDLREVNMGVWEQKTWGEIGNDYPEQLTNFTRRMDQWQVEGAESAAIVRDRMLGAIRAIAAENEGKTVAAFSHGCALRILLGTLEGYSLAQLGDTAHGDNTAVSLLEIADDKIRVVFRDDNAHVTETSAFSSQDWWSRPNGIQPGLYFRPADEKTDAQLLAAAGASGTEKPTLCALLEGKAIGILQLDPTREEGTGSGWLAAYYIAPDFRQRGYGIQLLGQAVQFYRPRERLRLALPEGAAAEKFFGDYGFVPAEKTAQGETIFEKYIGYRK